MANLLIVDDSATFRRVLESLFLAAGYQVQITIDAVNALKILKKNDPPIDIVVSDLDMPHLDGLELKHEADRITGRSVPFVLVTANVTPETVQAAFQVGSASIVPKPVRPDKLLDVVATTLKQNGIEPPPKSRL